MISKRHGQFFFNSNYDHLSVWAIDEYETQRNLFMIMFDEGGHTHQFIKDVFDLIDQERVLTLDKIYELLLVASGMPTMTDYTRRTIDYQVCKLI